MSTFMQWVANILTKIQKKTPNAIIIKGYIKLAISKLQPPAFPTREVDEMTNAAHVD